MIKTHLIIMFVLVAFKINAQMSLMTYNIRYDNPNDEENKWEYRKQELSDMIKHYQPDILGIQEGINAQVKYLDSTLTNYNFVGVGRADGIDKGEYTAIFYNEKAIELIETKTFWLSEKPNTISVGWDALLERIVTYAKFKNKSNNKIIHIFNCHFDHVGEIARENSSRLILEIIKNKGIEDEGIALIGDLNCTPDEKPIKILKTKLKDSYEVNQSQRYGPVGTFNGFNIVEKVTKRIDYILIKNLTVKQYINIDDRRKNNLWLSDHLPILIEVE